MKIILTVEEFREISKGDVKANTALVEIESRIEKRLVDIEQGMYKSMRRMDALEKYSLSAVCGMQYANGKCSLPRGHSGFCQNEAGQ